MIVDQRYKTVSAAIAVVLCGCVADPTQPEIPASEMIDDPLKKRYAGRAQPETTVSEMTDEQLQERYMADIQGMECVNAPDNGDMAAALRCALDAKRLDSVQEFERRGKRYQQERINREQIAEEMHHEQVRLENERMDEVAIEKEQSGVREINEAIANAQADGIARQAEDIQLLEENRMLTIEENSSRAK